MRPACEDQRDGVGRGCRIAGANSSYSVGFYPLQLVASVIGVNKVRCVYLLRRLPRVVGLWISAPLDEVLELSRPSVTSVASYLLHFVLLFSLDKVRWRSGEVGAVGGRFAIG